MIQHLIYSKCRKCESSEDVHLIYNANGHYKVICSYCKIDTSFYRTSREAELSWNLLNEVKL